MKKNFIITLSALILVIAFGSCKKGAAGPGGENSIHGGISYINSVSGSSEGIPYASISIAYGTKGPTGSFNKTILADATGQYSIEGLNPGDYFLKAEYTSSHGFHYTTNGVGITFNNTNRNLEVNLVLE